MKQSSPLLLTALCAAPFFIANPAQAQSNDILSILARQTETPGRAEPTTIDYSYTMNLDIKAFEGDKTSDVQAVLRVDPTQPGGSRAQIISTTDPENESFVEFLKEIEDPEKTMAEQADGFWCGVMDGDAEFNPDDFQVISETETEAIIKPKPGTITKFLMQSDSEDEEMGKQERKMAKKLLKRIDGQMTLSKPQAELQNFQVKMTEPMSMMLVAKLKVMDVEQDCALAPNGFYHMSTMNMNVEGKALGKEFGQKMDIKISDLRALP